MPVAPACVCTSSFVMARPPVGSVNVKQPQPALAAARPEIKAAPPEFCPSASTVATAAASHSMPGVEALYTSPIETELPVPLFGGGLQSPPAPLQSTRLESLESLIGSAAPSSPKEPALENVPPARACGGASEKAPNRGLVRMPSLLPWPPYESIARGALVETGVNQAGPPAEALPQAFGLQPEAEPAAAEPTATGPPVQPKGLQLIDIAGAAPALAAAMPAPTSADLVEEPWDPATLQDNRGLSGGGDSSAAAAAPGATTTPSPALAVAPATAPSSPGSSSVRSNPWAGCA